MKVSTPRSVIQRRVWVVVNVELLTRQKFRQYHTKYFNILAFKSGASMGSITLFIEINTACRKSLDNTDSNYNYKLLSYKDGCEMVRIIIAT